MFRVARRLPFFKLLAVAEVALLVRRHLARLTPAERRRLAELARKGFRTDPLEREELRAIVGKLEPAAFAAAAADAVSPIPLGPRVLRRALKRRG
jgi:hypothetical protein